MPKPRAVLPMPEPTQSGTEDEINSSDLNPRSNLRSKQETSLPATKGRGTRGRPKASQSKLSKPKASSQRSGPGSGITKARAPTRKKVAESRAVLKERLNGHNGKPIKEGAAQTNQDAGTLSMEEIMASSDELISKTPGAKNEQQIATRLEPREVNEVNVTENEGEFEYTPKAARPAKSSKNSSSAKQQAVAGKRTISNVVKYDLQMVPDTQEAPTGLYPSPLPESEEDLEMEASQSVFLRSNDKQVTSRQPLLPLSKKRAGSTSDHEGPIRGPATRQKLEDITHKFENLEAKYKALEKIGIKEAEANFEQLKVQSESKAKAAENLINSLKKELATQTNLAQKTRSLEEQLVARNKTLQEALSQTDQLFNSLTEVQNENKALQVKLANSRSVPAAVESANARTPGSIIRGKATAQSVTVGSAEAAQAAQVALLKEELYSDLTGLILRGVERGEDADLYDCIQTGRNGTLHFHLSIATDPDAKASSYESTVFTYTPRLDPDNRDRDLMLLLPEYLSEEIEFSRQHAARFYGRVVDTLTRKRED